MSLVNEMFDADLLHLKVEEEKSEYWFRCAQFIEQVKDKDYEDLSEKQQDWVDRIKSDLEDGEE